MSTSDEDHHPFCNLFSQLREGCTMCERMYKMYPTKTQYSPIEKNLEDNYVIREYFPNVNIIREVSKK
jgi:hypothetical protein